MWGVRWYLTVVLILHFPEVKWYSHMYVDRLYVFFGRMSIEIICLFFNHNFKYIELPIYLYNSDINPWSDISLASEFYISIGCPFILLMVFSTAQKLFVFCFCFLGPHLWHMEVPRLGSNQSYSCQPTPQPQQCQIWAMSVTYTTGHSNVGSLAHWVRPGIQPATSCFLGRFVSAAPQWELQKLFNLK